MGYLGLMKPLQSDIFYEAMLARDYRFDGKFFVGVKTTGIYCRPICPARPKRENVEFYTSALAAEKAGYRPCKRCRPEAAPVSAAWSGKSAVVQRALRMIAAGDLERANEDVFADRFGMTARHLRRLFEQEVGRTPKQIAAEARLGFARKLIAETSIPIAQIALTAGFSSLRRFNDAFKKRFQQAPSSVRKKIPAGFASGHRLLLPFRPPYDWDSILAFYRSHSIPGLDTVADGAYQRHFEIDEVVGFLSLRPVEGKSSLELRVTCDDPRILFEVVRRVRRMFDLDSDPLLIANSFARVSELSRFHKKFPGLRLPRGWDPFESAVSGILGQFVSVTFASQLAGQVLALYGREVVHPVSKQKVRVFPSAERLAKVDLAELKTTGARKRTIREFARRVSVGEMDLSDTQDPIVFRDKILSLEGIGPWTAEYISLRAIGDTDAFPGTDLILKRALEKHPRMNLDLVKPWRSYAAIYLWKEYAQALSKKKEKRS